MAKCLRNRGVMGFRPPPGGAQAAVSVTPEISCNMTSLIKLINKRFQENTT